MRVLTVDLEYDWEGDGTRSVTEVLPELLKVLRRRRAHATFFTLGHLAERFPREVRALARKGHEIAAHGYMHHPLSRCTPAELRTELRKTRQAFQRIKADVKGFRAPYFMTPPGFLPALRAAGFTYDSSLSTLFPGRYLNLTPKKPYRKDGLWELPIPDFTPLGGPPAGLSYYRLLHPASRLFRKPYMLYLHPYEFLDAQPGGTMNILVRKAVSRNCGSRAWSLLEELLGGDQWTTCSDYLQRHAK
jgi:peptidoglycan/xylan/chitin deacetylase (PgdA/CDA1 family)